MKDLEHLRVLTISGEDAGELLQGQMTQDIRKLEDDKIHITSFCNVQGRVI
ncbi:MAG: folate-binding protein, partial [Gammaproteobacteria bacterium]